MQKQYSIPLLFFSIAALFGLFLRWQFIDPTPGIRYTWFLHSHSHVMFLGWVMNVLFLAFVSYHFTENEQKGAMKFFWIFQILVVAMMISFPIQGYGTYSIIFSTLHTLVAMAFIINFLIRTRKQVTISLWFARVAWIFFFISTAGPFSLGYLMANGLGQTVWYNFSIYYYLHFQYNGFFIFGILSLFFQLLERKGIAFNCRRIRRFGILLAAACVPAYALSILFAQPGLWFNMAGAVAGLLQLCAVFLFIRELIAIKGELRMKFRRTVYHILRVILLVLIAKSFLQLFSAHPQVAEMAYELRPVVIAYLHLVLVGIIALFLLSWYMEMNMVMQSLSVLSVTSLLFGFIGSELCLVLLPWWSKIIGEGISPVFLIFWFSVFMAVGALLFFASFLMKKQLV